MNVAEIENAVAELVEDRFSRAEFFFCFMAAYAAPPVTITKMQRGDGVKSDVDDAWLWRLKIHGAVCDQGSVDAKLKQLEDSKATKRGKVRYVLATDGQELSALDLKTGDPLFCPVKDLADHFGFFLPLAGYERYKAAEENPVDIRATARLAKFYDAILRHDPSWSEADRRHDMNTFMTRVIFCLFAEDTGIFSDNLFSQTVHDLGGKDGENLSNVLSTVFETMSLSPENRGGQPAWAKAFPYVNGGLFDGTFGSPSFNKSALNYLIQAGRLDWQEINPDIFGSMAQSIVDIESRGSLGMHYTSVPNILKVLDPLFLNNLRAELSKAWDSVKRLQKFLARLERIRVFDPACGSGNFLVITYRELRTLEIEALGRIWELTGNRTGAMFSRINLNHFYGIEYADFATETAKLSLWVAEYQMNKRFEAVFGDRPPDLPLREGGQITKGNALRLNWEEVCPISKDEACEMYVFGNPPYLGHKERNDEQREDMRVVFEGRIRKWGELDYVCSWFAKSGDYCCGRNAAFALVATNSVCQGRQVPLLWPMILSNGLEIGFGHTSFKWSNNAAKNAGVTCVIVGIRNASNAPKYLIEADVKKSVSKINAYLVDSDDVYVEKRNTPLSTQLTAMQFGNMPNDGGNLILTPEEKRQLLEKSPAAEQFIRGFIGSQEFIKGIERYCLWIQDQALADAKAIPEIVLRIAKVKEKRLASKDKGTNELASRPHQFREMHDADEHTIVVPSVSSERRAYLPVGLLVDGSIVSNLAFALRDAPLWALALIASRLHLVWIANVCGKLENRIRYSSTLGWHTFPVPRLTDRDKAELTEAGEGILQIRERYFPATIAEMYDPDKMPKDLRRAHAHNDGVVEKIFAGRIFRNDTERLGQLFKLYVKMVNRGQETVTGNNGAANG
jgi:hypothetical protein